MKKQTLLPALALAVVSAMFVPSAFAAQPGCFAQYQNDVLDCSYKAQPEQTLCNLDAAVSLTACVRHAIF